MQCSCKQSVACSTASLGLHSNPATRRFSRLRVPQAAFTTTEAPPTTSTSQSSADAEVYLGKGRTIRDDPRKYPNKDDIGLLKGITGGWAGGEAALRKFIEQESSGTAIKQQPAAASTSGVKANVVKPPAAKGDAAPIYVGYGKDDLAARKSGVPGRFILDDPAKYPSKEDLGPLKGATGGFAGGEKGVRMLVEQGELRLRTPGSGPPVRQFSPVALAGLLVAAGAGGGVLLTSVTDLGEGIVKSEIVDAPIDDKTKALLLLAVVLLSGAGLVAGARAVLDGLQARIASTQEGAKKLVVNVGFGLLVFLAARAVLEW